MFSRGRQNMCKSLACFQDFLKSLLESRNFLCSATAATKTTLGVIQLWFNYFRGIVAYTLLGSMGVGSIFSEGRHSGNFPKFFQWWAKSGEISCFPLKTKKTTFFVENFKIRGAKAPMLGGLAKRCRGSWFIHSCLLFVYGDHQFANLSAPFQNAMPLDTHESAKSSSFPSFPNSLSNFSQLALRSDLAWAP